MKIQVFTFTLHLLGSRLHHARLRRPPLPGLLRPVQRGSGRDSYVGASPRGRLRHPARDASVHSLQPISNRPSETLLWTCRGLHRHSWAPQGTTLRLHLLVTGELWQLAFSPRGYEATCEATTLLDTMGDHGHNQHVPLCIDL